MRREACELSSFRQELEVHRVCLLSCLCTCENKMLCGLIVVGADSTGTDTNPKVDLDLNISLSATGMPQAVSVSPDR